MTAPSDDGESPSEENDRAGDSPDRGVEGDARRQDGADDSDSDPAPDTSGFGPTPDDPDSDVTPDGPPEDEDWKFAIEDVGEDGAVDRSIDPEPIDAENALFVLLGVILSVLIILRTMAIFGG